MISTSDDFCFMNLKDFMVNLRKNIQSFLVVHCILHVCFQFLGKKYSNFVCKDFLRITHCFAKVPLLVCIKDLNMVPVCIKGLNIAPVCIEDLT